jgi:DNA-directed RNA polymerase V subunit 1
LLRSNFINDLIKLYLSKNFVHDYFTNLVSFVVCKKGLGEVLQFMDVLQPMLMKSLILEGFSVSLKNFNIPKAMLEETRTYFQKQSVISESLFVEMRFEKKPKSVKIIQFIFAYNYVFRCT